jgi:hypothetical protein
MDISTLQAMTKAASGRPPALYARVENRQKEPAMVTTTRTRATISIQRRFAASGVGLASTKAVRALSALAPCLVLTACSVFDARLADDHRIVLGASDVLLVPKLSQRLDDYTCGTAALVCEDYSSKLRCRCARPAMGR